MRNRSVLHSAPTTQNDGRRHPRSGLRQRENPHFELCRNDLDLSVNPIAGLSAETNVNAELRDAIGSSKRSTELLRVAARVTVGERNGLPQRSSLRLNETPHQYRIRLRPEGHGLRTPIGDD